MARITSIVTPSRGSRRRLVHVDGDVWRETAVDAVRSLGWVEGHEAALPDLAAALDDAEVSCARQRALRLLNARDRGVSELAQRLAADGFPISVGQRVVTDLASVGYMDDSRSARAYVRGQARVRGTGRAGIAMRLRARGFDDSVVAEALDDELPAEDESAAATRLAAVYARGSRATVDKVASRLVRKGYPLSIALAAARGAVEDSGGHGDASSDELEPPDEGPSGP